MEEYYKKKYLKYKGKYLNAKLIQLGGTWPEYDQANVLGVINEVKGAANKAAFDLLKDIQSTDHKIATAESLTGGLIFATLVDVPFAGKNKYGCFGVYDSDAKRVFIGVNTDDVYTAACAKEMAVGVLKNSNATIAIAVTGNAMPYPEDVDTIGEVFIAIAGYKSDNEIYVEVTSNNFCNNFSYTCKEWARSNVYNKRLVDHFMESTLGTHGDVTKTMSQKGIELGVQNNPYAPLQITALVSMYVRHATVTQALNNCKKFIENHGLVVPSYISTNRIEKPYKAGEKPGVLESKKTGLLETKQQINKLLKFPDLKITCNDDTLCNDDKRTFKSLFEHGFKG